MKAKIFWLTITLLMVLSLTLAACSNQTTSTSTTTTTGAAAVTTSTTPVSTSSPPASQANWWDKLGTPQYGGTMTMVSNSLNFVNLDNMNMMPGGVSVTYEQMFIPSRTVDPNVFQYMSSFIPTKYYVGELAKSWDQTDPLTVIVKLRQGIHWTDKPPVNGRELTADDIQFNADRLLGTGSGYSTPNPFLAAMMPYTEKVTALDKYTVQFKFKQPSAIALWDAFAPQLTIAAPEWVKLYGAATIAPPGPPGGGPPGGGAPGGGAPSTSAPTTGANDWHTAITTAPYNISDFVPSSSVTFTKVSNYYLHDERFPQNQLPYIDSYKEVYVGDTATAEAALRTGKLDVLGGPGGGAGAGPGGGMNATWQDVKSLKQSNPGLQVWWVPTEGPSIQFRTDHDPFTNIQVRKALSMAIDRKTIAATLYGGSVPSTPCGLISPADTGWCIPFDQWPADLQAGYTYNPTQAKQLLAEAGFQNGFKTDIVASTQDNANLLQIIKSEFADIGVDMTINVMDEATVKQYVSNGKYDQMTSVFAQTGGMLSPWLAISVMRKGDMQNATHNDDATFDAMYQKIVNSTSEDEAKQLTAQADQYVLKQYWELFILQGANSAIYQPWVKGYTGGTVDSGVGNSRLWIDQSLK